MEKKKKTLTISSSLKKIDTTSIQTSEKKSFSVDKKKPFKGSKPAGRQNFQHNPSPTQDYKKEKF